MKKPTQLVVLLLITMQLHSQKAVETESVTHEDLIPFVIENFEEDGEPQNITFLLKTHASNFSEEDKFILKQTFKFLSKRLSKDDYISIATYNHYNGIALSKASPDNLKKLLHVIEYPKASIKAFGDDGIELAYKHAKENYEEDYENKVIMVRLPERQTTQPVALVAQNVNTKQNGNGAAVVLSALALLPEIISVIKN
ncbi:MAG: hypothetical protein ED556_06680 [Winogradskyella sp.]|uniref:hypothetical protein n=1 Tax=Winogradskyella sp. TaxID=1883156 RepID=UPI000F41A469|nr:hypothetical protein [Winogradskyella sp.]RNC87104.1 MAG: hypothetical protein ED556_06680 [Winogradskyella sp.]